MPIAPQVGAAIVNGVSSIASAGLSAGASGNLNSRNRKFQHQENQLARDWQSWENKNNRDWQAGESKIARDWEEQMYLQYNTPSAMMQQYKDAGVNPYLSQVSNLGQGMGTAAPMSGSPASGTPPMSASPSSAMPDFSSLNDLGSKIMQAFGIQSQLANQDANTKSQLWSTAYQVYKEFGVDAYKAFAKQNNLFEGSPVNSLYSQLIAGQVMKEASETHLNNIVSSFKSNYEAPQAEAYTNVLKKQIGVMEESIVKLKSESDLNYGKFHELGSEVARNMAQAGLFKAMSGQINELLPYLTQQAAMSLGMTAMQYLTMESNFSLDELVREWQHTDKAKKTRKISRGMQSDVNAVGAFMDGFVSKVPAPLWNNSFNTRGYSRSSGSENSGSQWNWEMNSWYQP